MGSINTEAAVDFIKSDPLPCIVDNKPFKTSQTYPVYRIDVPQGQSEVLHNVSCCSPDDARKAVDSSAAALPAWKATPVATRRDILLKANALLQQRIPEYCGLTMQETCLSRGMAGFELSVLTPAHLNECASSIGHAIKAEQLPSAGDGTTKIIQREPYGVVLGIAPWNAPFLLALRSILYPIAAGNTAILKTSEFAPRVHLTVAQLLIEAGLPAGVLNVVHVDPKDAAAVTEALISHKAVRKINFTGSTRVGRIIAQTAAKYLKPVVLELGGKAPVIVLQDADLHLAANGILFGGYLASGQVCMSVNNIVVHESVAKDLEQAVRDQFEQNKAIFTAKHSQGMEDQHALRSLFSHASGERIKALYDDAVSQGAKVVVGQAGFEGALVQPIVLGGVSPSMKIYTEESFAPVLSLITFSSVEEAIQIANSNDAGLAASVYGRDQMAALQVAQAIESGQVHINAQPVHDDPAMPHGGCKQSGYGRFNGVDGIREFTQTKGITISAGHPMPFAYV